MYLALVITLLSLITFNISEITKPILRWIYKTTSDERSLHDRKMLLRSQQSSLSVVDDFPKYSRLQRSINAIDQELAERQNDRLKNNIIVNLTLTNGIKLSLYLILFGLSVYYRYTPVMYISKEFDLFPIASFVSFPNSEANAVSLPFWIICCSSISKLIKFRD